MAKKRTKTSKRTEALKSQMTSSRSRAKRSPIKAKDLLSSGSTLLNLACSGKPSGAFYKGGYFNLVGSSDSGKTVLTMTMFAEAAHNKSFQDHLLVHDNAEGGALMDVASFFGKRTAERLQEPPHGTSEWVEDFWYNLDELYKSNQPFVYVLDSMDALTSRQDEELFAAKKKARLEGKDGKGGYGTAKAKANSEGLRHAVSDSGLKASGSILVIVSQTRDNLGAGPFGEAEKQSGGRALKFYARLQIWTRPGAAINKVIRGKEHQIGITCKVRVKKNHVIGKKQSVDFPILNDYGIDDIGSCIDWLLANGAWKKKKRSIVVPDFGFEGGRDKLIEFIENEGRQKELQMMVSSEWREIEKACESGRSRRYV